MPNNTNNTGCFSAGSQAHKSVISEMTDAYYEKHGHRPLTAAIDEMPFNIFGRYAHGNIDNILNDDMHKKYIAPAFKKDLERFPKKKKNQFLNYVLLTSNSKEETSQKLAIYAVDILKRRWKEAEPHILYDEVAKREEKRKKGIRFGNNNGVGYGYQYYRLHILETLKRYKFW